MACVFCSTTTCLTWLRACWKKQATRCFFFVACCPRNRWTRLSSIMPQPNALVVITCNRDDFIPLASSRAHSGLLILIRRRSRILERAKLLRLLESAGQSGLAGNINFA